jgi:hypothetical protein
MQMRHELIGKGEDSFAPLAYYNKAKNCKNCTAYVRRHAQNTRKRLRYSIHLYNRANAKRINKAKQSKYSRDGKTYALHFVRREKFLYIIHRAAVIFPFFVSVAASERERYLGVFEHHSGERAYKHPKQCSRAAEIYRA